MGAGGAAHANVVAAGAAGFMTGSDKTKLDGLANYTLPIAGASTLGGIKVGANLSIDAGGVLSASGGSTTFAASREVSATKAVRADDSRLRTPFAINYIANPDAEIDLTGWVAYNDGASAVPVDGTGGTPAFGYAFTRSVNSSLSGTATFQIANQGNNVQGSGSAYAFAIDGCDANKSLSIKFEVLNVTSVSTGQYAVFVYDVTNARFCPISQNTITGNGTFTAQFSASSSTSYRLCVHTAGTAASNMYVLLDNFYVGPVYLPSCNAMSDWQDGGSASSRFGATTTAPTFGTLTRDKIWFRRVGDTLFVRVELEQTSAGGAGSGDYLLALPLGLSIDTSKCQTDNAAPVTFPKTTLGTFQVAPNTAYVGFGGWVHAYDATRVRFYGLSYNSGGASGDRWNDTSASRNFAVSSIRFSCEFSVPIAGWSGTTAVQPGSRYLWAQRFAANAVRVTAAPTQLGQYRARNGVTDTAPTTGPAASDGLRIHVNPAAGNINWYDIYVGPGKIVRWSVWQSAGRTAPIDKSIHYIVPAGTNTLQGCVSIYDPVSGVATIWTANSGVGRESLGLLPQNVEPTNGYCDILVADDPVPVALAPSVHVEAYDTAGQSATASVTNLQYATKLVDTHGAWSGSVFTAPVAGVYQFNHSSDTNAAMVHISVLYVNGTAVKSFMYFNSLSSWVYSGVHVFPMNAGDTASLRCANASYTRYTGRLNNTLSIARIGN